jgi:hypothetical protein
MPLPKRLARCAKCGHVAPLRAFEVEVALSADDSGDNDWVINYQCPACEAADRPHLLDAAPGDQLQRGPQGQGDQEPARRHGVQANPMYDPAAP